MSPPGGQLQRAADRSAGRVDCEYPRQADTPIRQFEEVKKGEQAALKLTM